MKKKKPSKISDKGFLAPTIPNIDSEMEEFSSALAYLLVGVNPYMDISTVHVLVMDLLAAGLHSDTALEAGKYIAQRARISVTDDCPGGLQ